MRGCLIAGRGGLRGAALVAAGVVAALGAIAGLGGCGSSSRAASGPGSGGGAMAGGEASMSLMDETPIEAPGATLHVQGLSCPACATNVNQQLGRVSGVSSVGVNLGDGTVRVEFDALAGKRHPSRAELARAIHDSGFTLTRIEVAGQ